MALRGVWDLRGVWETLAPNVAPVANAGADLITISGRVVTLDGSFSSDTDQTDTLTYFWSNSHGITLQNANTKNPSFIAPIVSTNTQYEFTLTVSDGSESSTDSVVVTVRFVTLEERIKQLSELKFTTATKTVTAHKNRSTRDVIKYKPNEIKDSIVLIDGYFDFDNNNVTKIEITGKGEKIDSETSAVTWAAEKLSIELGALKLDEQPFILTVIVYIGADTKGIVFSGEGLESSIYCQFETTY